MWAPVMGYMARAPRFKQTVYLCLAHKEELREGSWLGVCGAELKTRETFSHLFHRGVNRGHDSMGN